MKNNLLKIMRELWISIAIIHQTDGKGDKKMKKIVATLFL